MERSTNKILLDLIDRPVFCVRDGIIIQVNEAARQRFVTPGTRIADLLTTNAQAYEAYTGGSLFLTLHIAQIPCQAYVERTEDGDLFLLEQDSDVAAQALALSAQHLRSPLQTLMALAEQIQVQSGQNETIQQLTKGLFQIQRILANMADTTRYHTQSDISMETTDLSSLYGEIMEKAVQMVSLTGHSLRYTDQTNMVFGLANREILERAVYNLLSNAIKYSDPGSTLEAKLSCSGNILHFTLQDPGSIVPPEISPNLFTRYLRQPGIEDGRNGIGLGLAIVRAAAACHGGTVLMEKLPQGGTRICMSIVIRQNETTFVRTPVRLPSIDYSGGYDHALLELAELLPPSAFKDIL